MADRLVANAQYSALMRLYRKGGNKLTAAEVVEAARDAKSPLHPAFEWDDTEAAARFRLIQAGKLISSFRVETVRGEEVGSRPALVRTVTVVATAKSGDAEGRTASVYKKPEHMTAEEREGVLRRMRSEINSLTRRYGALEEFWEALDATKKSKRAS
jgi:hypothetical protein